MFIKRRKQAQTGADVRTHHRVAVEAVCSAVDIPVQVGGGLRTVADMHAMLKAGADKISINSSALATPDLIRAGAEKFGSQCIVVSIDARKTASDRWMVFSHGGRKSTGFASFTRPWISLKSAIISLHLPISMI